MRRVRRCFLLLIALAAGCSCPSKPARLRKVDVHTHFGPDSAARTMKLLSDHGIDACVNLSGSYPGDGLEEQLETARQYPGRIIVFAQLNWDLAREREEFGALLAMQLRQAHQLGAKGLKIEKGLGLGYPDASGKVIAVDDPRLDPIFEAAGELKMPIAIHTGDPVAFWEPVTSANERLDELTVHPRWSLYGKRVPTWEELFAQLTRRIARHPNTTFISVHFGNAPEYPERVFALMDQYPNLNVDTAARVPEIGRYDAAKMRALFEKHADRILFGTDLGVGAGENQLMLGSPGKYPPTPEEVERFFSASWRYFETDDEQFEHPTPIQGRWKINGIKLPREVLRKVYAGNADRILGLQPTP
jgi:predicted TIM-barrel fold metal-dependent hydrolase